MSNTTTKQAPKRIYRECQCGENGHLRMRVPVLCDDGREYLKTRYICRNCNRHANTKHADMTTTPKHS